MDNQKPPEFLTPPDRGTEINQQPESKTEAEHVSPENNVVHDTGLLEKIQHSESSVHSDTVETEVTVPEEVNDIAEVPVAPPKQVIETMLANDIRPSTEHDFYEEILNFSGGIDEK